MTLHSPSQQTRSRPPFTRSLGPGVPGAWTAAFTRCTTACLPLHASSAWRHRYCCLCAIDPLRLRPPLPVESQRAPAGPPSSSRGPFIHIVLVVPRPRSSPRPGREFSDAFASPDVFTMLNQQIIPSTSVAALAARSRDLPVGPLRLRLRRCRLAPIASFPIGVSPKQLDERLISAAYLMPADDAD